MQAQKARILFTAAVAHVLAVSLFMRMRRNLKGQAAASVSLLLWLRTCSGRFERTFGVICNDINSVASYCCQYSIYFDRHLKLCPS